ncbi:MAG: TonB-dependent receptor [Prevotella sp.]|nr:TonB-dependent receptor [Prevotella sp.]
MTRVLYLIIYIIFISNVTVSAQDHGQILEQAEQDYQIGRFGQVLSALESHIKNFQYTNKQRALRLIALCYLAQDNEAKAEQYARQLVELNNYYTGVDDPPRFEELVNKLKAGQTVKVTTASSVAEGIEEAPVPVTIITAEMIENLGYNKNISHILATYVPGMTDVLAENEENIAMHGAFARTQELILVMENGHRLNNRTYNSSSLDYSLSTEKIDRIEVLRGPASSLYGNVALSAVVNIITKQGADVNGIKAKYGYGTFNTHKADITLGTRFMDADVFIWGSFYQSDGQKLSISDAENYINTFNIEPAAGQYAHADRYRDKPCYDIGMTFRFKNIDFTFSRKNSRSVPQFTESYGLYDYDRYAFFNGIKPGSNRESNHAELGYTHQLGNITLSASAYGDWYTHQSYYVNSPENPENEQLPDEKRIYSVGCFDYTNMKEYTLGGNLRASTNYKLGSQEGNLLVGSQFEHFSFHDYLSISGKDYEDIRAGSTTEGSFFDLLGKENNLSFYVQDKHSFTSKLILNAGMRYDIKHRRLQSNITAWSPRLALIYLPYDQFNLKLTYARSFVDMAYYFRCQSSLYNEDFLPQYLTAIQLSMLGKVPSLHLSYDVNISYNKFKNLYSNSGSEKKWVNEGSYENLAFEISGYYNWQRLTANLTLYWCKALSANSYYYSDNEKRVACVPNQTANLNVGWKLINHPRHQLKLYGNIHYMGKTLVQTRKFVKSEDVEEDYYLNRRVLFDAGIKYSYNQHLHLALDCENLFNTASYVTGPAWTMYPEKLRGRNVMASVAVSF